MLDDLIRMRKEQEEKTYVPLEIYEGEIMYEEFGFRPLTIEEIENKENTIEFIKECEELIKEVMFLLDANAIEFDEICLESLAFLACKKGFAEKFVNCSENDTYSLLNELESNISLKYVPLKFAFYIDSLDTKVSDKYLYKKLYELENKHVTGFVNLDVLIKVMKELGYSVKINSISEGINVECTSIEDYINYQKKYTSFVIDIVADFTKELKNEISYSNQIKR